ncbi:3-deoxy-D-manno-octulosonic acid transferase [Pedobacter sp. SYSU D00535]|uniref:3-deoxy-D-manno-octulosonic acid transferase n=1 Tax=Pedobacter sp. SYSU D00535 TaxID=2810308 RepID=UPI001A957111|nr:glycosyltransferase N-terminal domain-containing protein [Pedobacter sp. SYSU D00535]
MLILYNFGIGIYYLLIFIFHFFNTKAKLWIEGRRNLFQRIAQEVDPRAEKVWFHFASLGEFEQGRPVLEKVREQYPNYKTLITFFSPSGYELRKNYQGADYIFYLPLDTRFNAEKFIQLTKPQLAIFTKYEFWYHYFKELQREGIPLYLISGIFRESQPFFKWYGGLNRKMLKRVSHFFVQDGRSKQLLEDININNVTVSGDTRFDRVAENAASAKQFEKVETFCGVNPVLVAGSTWPEDEKLIAGLAKEYPQWKFVVAPHEIKEEKIQAFISLLEPGIAVRYSEFDQIEKAFQHRVLIIDNIGMLSSLYQYGKVAYIGGGFGVGIHNTLEAAAFAIPVIFGPNYDRFLEAKALISAEAGFSISNREELQDIMRKLQNEEFRTKTAAAAGRLVQEGKGATGIILNHLEKQLANPSN